MADSASNPGVHARSGIRPIYRVFETFICYGGRPPQTASSIESESQMSRPRKEQVKVSSHEMRKTLEADVKAYLKSGKKIEQVPTGFTNQDPLGGRRHIVLGGPKKNG